MAGRPRSAGSLLPDRGIAGLATDGVAVDLGEPIALSGELVELRLVLAGGEAMAGRPRSAGSLLPDRGVAWLAGDGIPVNLCESVTASRVRVERVLILSRSHSMSCCPCSRHRFP